MDIVLAIIIFAAALFCIPLLSALAGAFSGWVVGLFFSATILHTLGLTGLNTHGLEMWELGATLGFVGGFFQASFTAKKD